MAKQPQPELSAIGRAALEMAKTRSWKVFPCNPLNKRPMTPHGFKDATSEPKIITEWWQEKPNNMIGVATGAVSGFFAVDLDRKEGMGDGLATWRQWELDAGVAPVTTRQHTTPSTGQHLLFRYLPGVGCVPLGKLGEGIEIKGDGGYVIAPPSIMDDGKKYEVTNKDIADAPEFLLEKLRTYYGNRSSSGATEGRAGTDPSEIEEALFAIPCAKTSYSDWVYIGSALHRELGAKEGKSLFIRWSATDKTMYKDEHGKSRPRFNSHECALKWDKDITKFKQHTIRTLFHYADQADPEWRTRWDQKKHKSPPPKIELFDLFPVREEDIPLRDWVIPGLLLRKHVAMTAAPGGTGKSVLTLCFSIMMALPRAWARWRPRKRCKVWIINTEEDHEEMMRRGFAVALRSMDVKDNSVLKGWVRVAKNPGNVIVAKYESRSRNMMRQPLVDELITIIRREKFDVVIVDPFAETFIGEETVMELKVVAGMWREVARAANCAIWLIHHTRKYASEMAGDVDAARGATSLANVTRIVNTLFSMTKKEADEFGVSEDDRTLYIRLDDAKANYDRASSQAQWFRMETVHLQNQQGDIPGDNVGVPIPWQAPTALDGINDDATTIFMATVDRGMEDDKGNFLGEYYTINNRPKSGDAINRWVGILVQKMFKCDEGKAHQMIKQWTKANALVEFAYRSPGQRKWSKGCGGMGKKAAMEALPEAQGRMFKDSK